MGTIVLVAVLLDRAPLSMRLVAWAAAAIIIAMPEAVLGPSFQMSFAAVVALIAAWEAIARPLQRWRSGAGIGLQGLLMLAGSLVTTLIASCATAPFALYHFNRVALFSVAANLLAVPLTSILVMPAAVLVLALLPFGLEAWPLAAMNAANALVSRSPVSSPAGRVRRSRRRRCRAGASRSSWSALLAVPVAAGLAIRRRAAAARRPRDAVVRAGAGSVRQRGWPAARVARPGTWRARAPRRRQCSAGARDLAAPCGRDGSDAVAAGVSRRSRLCGRTVLDRSRRTSRGDRAGGRKVGGGLRRGRRCS